MVFFFQAEDGIRDLYVTGVQTCALPILLTASAVTVVIAQPLAAARALRRLDDPVVMAVAFVVLGIGLAGTRSEERRVGKECRSRWTPHYYKKRACSRDRYKLQNRRPPCW